MRIQTYVALALLSAMPFAACAQDTAVPAVPPSVTSAPPDASAVTLRYKFTPGQTRRYKMTMTMNDTTLTGQSGADVPMNMVMTMTMKQTVKSVRPSDGAATIVAQLEGMEENFNGKAYHLPAAMQAKMKHPFTTVMLPTGKVLSLQIPLTSSAGIPGMPGGDFGNGYISSVTLPDTPVKVGDSWPGSVASSMAGMQTLVSSTLAGLETKGDAQLATIDSKMSGKINNTSSNKNMTVRMAGTFTGSGTQVFDATVGALVSGSMVDNADMTETFHPAAGQTAPSWMLKSVTVKMQRKIETTLLDDAASAAPAQ